MSSKRYFASLVNYSGKGREFQFWQSGRYFYVPVGVTIQASGMLVLTEMLTEINGPDSAPSFIYADCLQEEEGRSIVVKPMTLMFSEDDSDIGYHPLRMNSGNKTAFDSAIAQYWGSLGVSISKPSSSQSWPPPSPKYCYVPAGTPLENTGKAQEFVALASGVGLSGTDNWLDRYVGEGKRILHTAPIVVEDGSILPRQLTSDSDIRYAQAVKSTFRKACSVFSTPKEADEWQEDEYKYIPSGTTFESISALEDFLGAANKDVSEGIVSEIVSRYTDGESSITANMPISCVFEDWSKEAGCIPVPTVFGKKDAFDEAMDEQWESVGFSIESAKSSASWPPATYKYIPNNVYIKTILQLYTLVSNASGVETAVAQDYVNSANGVHDISLIIDDEGNPIPLEGHEEQYESAMESKWSMAGVHIDEPETTREWPPDVYRYLPKGTSVTSQSNLVGVVSAVSGISQEDATSYVAGMLDENLNVAESMSLLVKKEGADFLPITTKGKVDVFDSTMASMFSSVGASVQFPYYSKEWPHPDLKYKYLPKDATVSTKLKLTTLVRDASSVPLTLANSYVNENIGSNDLSIVIDQSGFPRPINGIENFYKKAMDKNWSSVGASVEEPYESQEWPPPQPVPEADLLTGLTHHWALGDTAMSYASSVSGDAKTIGGFAGDASWSASGRIGGCVAGTAISGGNYNGGDWPLQPFGANRTLSLSLWLRMDSASSTSHECGFMIGRLDTGGAEFVGFSADRKPCVFRAGPFEFVKGTTALSVGWHHFVLVGDSGTLTCYCDGAVFGTAAVASQSTSTSAEFKFGRGGTSPAGCVGLNGAVDEISVWLTRAIGQAEVTALYNGGAGLPFEEWT